MVHCDRPSSGSRKTDIVKYDARYSGDDQRHSTDTLPTLAVLIGILVNNSKLSDLRSSLNDLRVSNDKRFDDVRDYIRVISERHDANLRRVEEVIDARPKHLEEQEH